jgi:BirA family biotin operon repressor/biotin-[acetyl-CoA-carboxylase] ligase
MNHEEIRAKIRGNLGREIFFYAETDSTNSLALKRASKAGEGTVIIADSQTKGRGRLGRHWVSPPGVNIYMSIILKPAIAPRDITLLAVMASVACAHALNKVTALDVSIKWPNDLVVNSRKIGGILSEMKTDQGKIVSVILGIGINVNMDRDAFPEDLRETATSVKIESDRLFSREELVAEIFNEIDTWYNVLKTRGRTVLLEESQRLSNTIGKSVSVLVGQEMFRGFAETIDADGMLLVRLSSGEAKKISSGDLTVLR